jgi:hypothetical protein
MRLPGNSFGGDFWLQSDVANALGASPPKFPVKEKQGLIQLASHVPEQIHGIVFAASSTN